MMSLNQLLSGQVVDLTGDTLHSPAIVGKDERGSVGTNQCQKLAIDVRPDTWFGQLAHIINRTENLDVELLAHTRINDLYFSRFMTAIFQFVATQKFGDFLQRLLGS